MKKYIKYTLTIIVNVNCIVSMSQNINIKDSLSVLKVENEQLLVILDSIIEHDKECDFYDLNLVYIVHIQPTKYATLIQFSSCHKLIRMGDEIGCFTKKRHLVIVRGACEVALFKKTRCMKTFNYYQPSEGVDSNGTVIIDIYEDDSYTQWDYVYEKNKFTRL